MSLSDILTWWETTWSNGFVRKDVKKVGKSVQTDVYLVSSSKVPAGWKTFKKSDAMKNEDFSIGVNIQRYHSVL